MPKKMPKQRPGESKQDVGTPPQFIAAVQRMLGESFAHDLAASADNAKAPAYFSEQNDALQQQWCTLAGFLWLNPPYAKIRPWMEKCAQEAAMGACIAVLLPASVGSNWFARFVDGKAYVLFLRPRLTFTGHEDPYPKDLMLCIYNGPRHGYATWDWMTA